MSYTHSTSLVNQNLQGQKTLRTHCNRLCLHCCAACNLICDRWNCLVRIPSPNTNFPLCPNKLCIAGLPVQFSHALFGDRTGHRHHTDSKQQALYKQLPSLSLLANYTLWGLGFTVRLIVLTLDTMFRGLYSRCTTTWVETVLQVSAELPMYFIFLYRLYKW